MSVELQSGSAEKRIRLRWKRVTGLSGSMTYMGGSITIAGSRVYVAGSKGNLDVLSRRKWRWNWLGNQLLGLSAWHIAQLVDDKIYYFASNHSPSMVEYDTVLLIAKEIDPGKESPLGNLYMTSVFASWRKEIINFGGALAWNARGSNETHAFHVDSRSWKKLVLKGRPPQGRVNAASTLHGSKMYIYGGYDMDANILGDLWIAELGSYRVPFWSRPMVNGFPPICRAPATLHSFNGFLVLYGGHSEVGNTQTEVAIFVPGINTWQDEAAAQIDVKGQSPKSVSYQLGVTTSEGLLYVTSIGTYLLSQE